LTTSELLSRREVIYKFLRSKSGVAGAIILLALILISIYALVAIPLESYKEWSNPIYWRDYPKTVAPAWTNLGSGGKFVEHTILTSENAIESDSISNGIKTVTLSWKIDYDFDSYPSNFILATTATYSRQPILQLDVVRPDGKDFRLYYSTLPSPQSSISTFSRRVTSDDSAVQGNLKNYVAEFMCSLAVVKPQIIAFSDTQHCRPLKGTYTVTEILYFFDDSDSVGDSKFILGGQVFGPMGTDDLGRDLSIGILWGAPVALFIGLVVAVVSTLIGLVYGVFAGFKGRHVDEGMMRVNDIFYSLPFLPLLIILSVSIGRSIFLFVGFLVLFGWVGMAKVSRSLALQIKNLQYVEAAKLMGETDTKIIFRHIIPQLLPIAFASIALTVPAAILGEAALSFLGLGDPSIPTWGRILHDANSAGAAARGLWWWVMIPGFMIALTGAAFILIGNTLNKIVNPRSRISVI
jgi:peptide/nickel transport system permease protein